MKKLWHSCAAVLFAGVCAVGGCSPSGDSPRDVEDSGADRRDTGASDRDAGGDGGCSPACTPGRCDVDDGCGASCGCPAGASCVGGSCVAACEPNCWELGQHCSDEDGCGGTCADVCVSLDLACVDGEGFVDCGCAPVCTGRDCGDDSCGGSCGTCTGNDVCVVDQCVCMPRCMGRVCGDDGCGGSCGACTGADVCWTSGRCAPPQPDLTVSSLTVEPSPPTTDRPAVFSFVVENIGTAPAPPSTATFGYAVDFPVDYAVPALAAGARHVITTTPYSGSLHFGFRVEAVVDARGDVAEADEANNARLLDAVFAPPFHANVDLAASFRLSPASPRAGVPTTMTLVVRNAGSAMAPATTAMLAVNGSAESFPVPALAGGATFDVSRVLTFGWSQLVDLSGRTDFGDVVGEANESNNDSTSTFTVGD